MSADILSKLRTLHDDVRARIEASSDFKAMKAVERAIGELEPAAEPAQKGEAFADATGADLPRPFPAGRRPGCHAPSVHASTLRTSRVCSRCLRWLRPGAGAPEARP